MNVDLHIERLVLEGMPLGPRERALMPTAFEGELARLLSAGELSAGLARGGAVPLLRGSNIQVTAGMAPTQLGIQIAHGVYGGIGKRS